MYHEGNSEYSLDIFFRQITTFIKVGVAIVFGLQLIDFIKIFQLQGLKPKNNDHTNFLNVAIWRKMYI